MNATEIEQCFEQLSYEWDDRRFPDNRRRGRFKAGWEDATMRGKNYQSDTLRRLTWHNLGYRFGKIFNHQTPEQIEQAYEVLARLYRESNLYPDEIREDTPSLEGARYQITVNAYERNQKARRLCIQHYGTSCVICGFSFGAVYGKVAMDFIHVHHLRPLSEIGEEYQVDPISDLRPVCPNCHAVLHRRTPPYSIEEIKAFLGHEKTA